LVSAKPSDDGRLGCARVLSLERCPENVLSLFNNNGDDLAPRSASISRRRRNPGTRRVEPPPMTPTLF
jgi:hypothetical protein